MLDEEVRQQVCGEQYFQSNISAGVASKAIWILNLKCSIKDNLQYLIVVRGAWASLGDSRMNWLQSAHPTKCVSLALQAALIPGILKLYLMRRIVTLFSPVGPQLRSA